MGCLKLTHFTDIELKLVHRIQALTLENTAKSACNDLEFISMPEGYIEPTDDGYKYVYRLTDHLGNTRVSFTKNQTTEEIDILQTLDFYPFGLEVERPNAVANSSNIGQNFKYNGKELQTEEGLDWYDYGWRNYNPSIGRWMNMDALSEEYLEHTPYNYTMSNPVRFTDVAGLYSTDEWMRDNGITQDDLTEVYNASDNENCCGGIGATIKAGVMSMFGLADGDDINTVAENNPEMAAQISNQNAEGARKRNMLAQSVADGLQTGDLLGVSTLVAGLQNGVSVGDAVNVATILPLGKGLKAFKVARASAPTGKFYSVAYEMQLGAKSYPGISRYMHFKEANITLNGAMKSNPMLGKLGISVPRSASGSIIGKSPSGWVWHHNTSKGVMQLVPKSQHPSVPGGIFWETMHPKGVGGYSIWGK